MGCLINYRSSCKKKVLVIGLLKPLPACQPCLYNCRPFGLGRWCHCHPESRRFSLQGNYMMN